MIGDWVAQAPALLAATAIVFVPGLAIGAGLRLRGLALWALAPVGTTVVAASLAIVYGAVHLPWSLPTVAIGVAVIVVIAWGAGLSLRGGSRRASRAPRAWGILAAGLVVGIGITAYRFVVYVNEPQAISQTNDAVFHLNALRYVLDTGSASSLHVSGVIGARGFYPAAWHGLASLLVLATGCPIPVAANLVTLVIAAGVWTIGMAWFVRELTGGDTVAAAVAATLSGVLWGFPMLMVEWGVLYPYLLAVALLPAASAVFVCVPRWLRGRGPVGAGTRAAVLGAVLALAAAGALALAQPAALLAWGLVGAVFATWRTASRMRAQQLSRAVGASSIVAVWLVLGAVWLVLGRFTSGSQWPPFRSVPRAVLDVVVNSHAMLPAAYAVSALMLVGLIVAVRRRRLRWLATAWAGLALLYIVCATVPSFRVRTVLEGAWYADPYRFAALAPLTAVPLASIGLVFLARWMLARLPRPRTAVAASVTVLVAAAVVGVVVVGLRPIVQMPAVTTGTIDAQSRYVSQDFLSADKRILLERLGKTTPAGAVIIGNPGTGAAFGYVLSGRDVYPRTWLPPSSPQWQVLARSLRDAASDPAVCAALAAFASPRYVLDFGPGDTTPGRWLMPGFTDFAGRPGFALVDRQGDASLWHITACGP